MSRNRFLYILFGERAEGIPRWLAFFLMGAAAMLGQALLMRQFLAVASGNELSLGLLFFAWFLGVSLGASLGGRLAMRARGRAGQWFGALLLLLVAMLGIQLGVTRALRSLLGARPGEYLSLGQITLGGGISVFPFSFLIGLIFPFAGQFARKEETLSAGGVSVVYILEAFGSLAAGLIFTFILLPWATPFAVWKGLAILAATLALVLQSAMDRRRAYTVTYLLLLVIALMIPSGWLERSTARVRWNCAYPGLTLVETRESPYSQLDLARQEGQYTLYANGQLAISFPDPFVYLEPVHGALVQHASPKTVLLVGGGPEMIPLVLSHGVDLIDWVQLDPVEMELILMYLPEENRNILDDPRVHLLYEDGRRVIQQARGEYDLILLSVPDPSSAQLNRYYTVEFYREAKRALKPDGVLAASIEASVAAAGEEVLGYGRIIERTLREVFSELAIQPGQTFRFYACSKPGQVTEDPRVMEERYRTRGAQPEGFSFGFEVLFAPDQVEQLRGALASPGPVAVNTDFHPVAYLHQLMLWSRWAGSDLSSPLTAMRGRSPWWMLALGLLLAAIRFGWISRRSERTKERFNLGIAVAAIGLTGMAVELVLLLGFQNVFGVLYRQIALFVALYMAGLAAGGLGIHRLVERVVQNKKYRRWMLMLLLALTALYVFAIPSILRIVPTAGLEAALVFYALALLSGALTGMGFPLAVSLYHEPGEPVARAAGAMDSMDHLGAMTGALLCATLWLPLWGVGAACAIVAGANLIAFLFVLL